MEAVEYIGFCSASATREIYRLSVTYEMILVADDEARVPTRQSWSSTRCVCVAHASQDFRPTWMIVRDDSSLLNQSTHTTDVRGGCVKSKS